MNRISSIPPRYFGLASLCVLSLLYLASFHYTRFGINEGAARGLLLDWTIGSQVISPVAVLGFPDLRALLFAPLNFHWIGDLTAAKVLTMYITFATALLLYRWAEKNLEEETALFATGLWLIAPLTIYQVDSIGAGNYLIFCAISSYWLNEHLRASERPISGYYFFIILVLALAASMHPAGLGMAIAVAWSWFREHKETRKRFALIGGLGTLLAFIIFSRMGWPDLDVLNNPLSAPASILFGDFMISKSTLIGFGLISGALLLLASIAAIRRSKQDLMAKMLVTGVVVGLMSPDRAWAQLALVLVLYEGIHGLLLLNSRLSNTNMLLRRGLVGFAVFIFCLCFMIADKGRYISKINHELGPTDEVISEVARLTSAMAKLPSNANKPINVATQWPGRTMLVTKGNAWPLPVVHKDDPEAFLKKMRGITFMAFNQYDNHNKLLRREVAELSDRVKTVNILPGGVIVEFPQSTAQKEK